MSQAAGVGNGGTRGEPFLGLEAYTEGDSSLFFGRDRARQALLGNLRTSRFTVLYAQSGAGKSSLLRAGVVPRLRDLAENAADLGVPRFLPAVVSSWSGDPIDTLKQALADASAGSPSDHSSNGDAAATLAATIDAAARSSDATFLVILDQFEEYFVHQRDQGRARFAEAIGRCVTRLDLPVNFLVSIREDAYASLGNLFKAHVPNVYGNYLHLLPLDIAGAKEAIRKPLEQFGVTAEPSLVEAVLRGIGQNPEPREGLGAVPDDTGAHDQYVAAPYLQLVMKAVWGARDDGSRILGMDVLSELGGTDQIVIRHVSKALGLPDDKKVIAASALRYLAPSDRGKLTLTVPRLAEFTGYPEEQLRPVLDQLTEQRILAGGDVPDSYELFHDLLARHIIRWRTDYEHARQTEAAREERKKRLDAEEKKRLAEEQTKREEEAKLKAEKRVRKLLIGIVVAVIAATAAIVTILELHARAAENTAESEQSSARAMEISDLGLASLYGLEGYRISRTVEARTAVLQLAASREVGRPFATHDDGIESVAWTRDGRTIATAGGDGVVGLWDAGQRREWARIVPPPAVDALRNIAHLGIVGTTVGAVAFSPDGRLLAYGENVGYYDARGNPHVLATVRLWDVQDRRPLRSFSGHTDAINDVAFSPDGSEVASASTDTTVRVWHVDGSLGMVLGGHTGPVNSVAFSPDAKVIASASCDNVNHEDTGDHSILLSSAKNGRVIGRLQGAYPVCGLAFSPNGKTVAAASDDDEITLWDVVTKRPLGLPLVGDTDVLNGVAFSPDGKTLASVSRDHSVRLWDVARDREEGTPMTHAGAVRSVVFSPDGKMLASAGPDGVRVWRVAGPYDVGVLSSKGAYALSVALSPDDRTLAWTDDYARTTSSGKTLGGTVYLYDTQQYRLLATIPAPTDNVNSLAFGQGGRILAWDAEADHSVWLWDVARDRLIARIRAPNQNTVIERVAFSPNGHTVAFADTLGPRTTIRLWDLQQHRYQAALSSGKTGPVGALAFSPNGQILASAGLGDGTVRLWDVRSGHQMGSPLRSGAAAVYDVAFSPDGKTLAGGDSDGSIRLWNVSQRRELGAPLTEDTAAVYGVAFGPKGNTLASASLDGTVRLWDVSTQRELLTLTGHTGYVFGVAFSPDGRLVASAGGDGTVRLWGNFAVPSAIARLCTYIDPSRAQALWQRYEPSVGYRQPC